jgi:CBS domain-containing protein
LGMGVVLRVRDVMTDKPVTLLETATVKDAVSVMASRDIGSVLVVNDKGELVGIFTERDLVKKGHSEGARPIHYPAQGRHDLEPDYRGYGEPPRGGG